jgi:5'(3')-deoxyribonucleotidase
MHQATHRAVRSRARKRILLDVDDVLGDFTTPFLQILSHHTKRAWTIDDFSSWDLFTAIPAEFRETVLGELEKPGWCRSIKPTEGSVEAVRELQSFCDVYVVTSPYHTETWVYERTLWLREHFQIDFPHTVFTAAKYVVVGDVLVDDKPLNIEKWLEHHPHGTGMLWDYPHTRSESVGIRVANWQEVICGIRALGV